jgi:orotate phosphoribosyltransferase
MTSKVADYKAEFIEFMLGCGVLTFGEFTLKSGRKSPYFLNAGKYNDGHMLAELGKFYAAAVKDSGLTFDTVFGPAYKGIPLAVSTAVALNTLYGVNVGYSFDRKEAKDHGDGGVFVGKSPENSKLILIDDVITSGKAVGETLDKLKDVPGAEVRGLFITVDRCEKALDSNKSAVQSVAKTYGFPVFSIVTIYDILAYFKQTGNANIGTAIEDYLNLYGVS